MTDQASSGDCSTFLASTHEWVDGVLDRLMPSLGTEPGNLHKAMRYSVFGGGKRFRPAVVRLVCRGFGGSDEMAEHPAAAIELVHTYSLVHDDLPCMDDDELRRGRPTCHVVFGDAMATLVGDALQASAFEILAGCKRREVVPELVGVLARAAGSVGMVGGQVLDIESSDGVPTALSVRTLQAMKTAAMIEASAELGALVAGASSADAKVAARWGRSLGLCFQVVDDLLDVTSDAAELGKTPGKDAALGRGTAVRVLGFEGAQEEAQRLAQDARDAAAQLGWEPNSLAGRLVSFTLNRSF
ncbi:MAG: polyprenyl synthetase family protein [Planctomycetota bacterium]|nr:polyprenyl synthetase family protein [Planctomycetota bacterium]